MIVQRWCCSSLSRIDNDDSEIYHAVIVSLTLWMGGMSKKLLLAVLSLVCLSVESCSYADQGDQARIYVKGGVVKPSKNGFIVVAKGWTIHTKALRHDKNGTYVLIGDRLLKKGYDEDTERYMCCKCGKILVGVYGPKGVKAHIAENGYEHRFVWPEHFGPGR